MIRTLFHGCATALVTPMKSGAVDYPALTRLIERQIEGGVAALVPCGTTGEASTLGHEEKRRVIAHTVEKAGGRVPVIAGCGSTSTAMLAILAREAEIDGADGVLCLTPFYNKANNEGVYLHFKTVCDHVSLPVIAYNVPSRTGLSIDIDTYSRLCELKNFAGVKEASGNALYAAGVLSKYRDSFPLYSGTDELTAPLYSLGSSGVISVAANIVPERVVKLCRLCEEGKLSDAAEEQLCLLPLMRALFSEVNPIPVKTALSVMGLCTDEMRLPLCHMNSSTKIKLLYEMKKLNVI
ncbi:MAG: 4-hydroxy-tetrahydrodipicolinate synthase [Ruminococcaceae bacterium]|nr:4-hydroxy-tetrahydrodipicolinate synthase [Oscillospiraceae bacterium]